MKKELFVKDAVVTRFKDLCKKRKIKLNELANVSGVTPSTVYSMMEPQRRHIDIATIKKLCDGLNITLADFFDDEIFENLEDEIR